MRIIGTITKVIKTENGIMYCCLLPQNLESCIHKSLSISPENDKDMIGDINERIIEDENFHLFAALPCEVAALGDVIDIVAECVEHMGDYFIMPNVRVCKVVHSKLYNHFNVKKFWDVIKESALR